MLLNNMILLLLINAAAAVQFYDPASNYSTLDTYFSNAYIKSGLEELQSLYPDLVKVRSLGYTPSQSNQMMEVTVTQNVSYWETHNRPNIKYVANMHGNEIRGRSLLMKLAYFLAMRYNVDEDVKDMLDTTVFHLIPTINPDGFDNARRGDCTGTKGRYSSDGLDMNRDFPSHWQTGSKVKYAGETEIVMQYAKDTPSVLSISFHDGALVANYPWDGHPNLYTSQYAKSPDDALFIMLAKTYSKNHAVMSDMDKQCDDGEKFPDGITNGNKWYRVFNGMQDWNYFYNDCFEVTLELGCCKYPTSEFTTNSGTWSDNFNSIMAYSQQAHIGIKGRVTDLKGNPLVGATISVESINKTITVRHRGGYYWRLLLPGSYSVTASKPGYYSLTRKNIVVNTGDATAVSFPLMSKSQVRARRAAQLRQRLV